MVKKILLSLPDKLHRKLKLYCVSKGITISNYIQTLLLDELFFYKPEENNNGDDKWTTTREENKPKP